ncbi:homoserine dehydrogenase [Microbacterium sp. NPDC089698]|jgi:homoserine dehydrogenase|uniref:homoserine dehydrogenase n=1 Tax=unclassified Microbacterium TaxID=2609290 RepID=UPI00283A7B95|nr:homoserine dehydrogenase [Microbacterium sp.]MDR2323518.1 homoserine dehydrogenase [Microbacterium sp.]
MTELDGLRRTLRVALLGAGSVGSQVARLLLEHQGDLAERSGARLELAGILVRDIEAPRDAELPRELLTTDAEALIQSADIVIELMGGIEPARGYVLQALRSGADVVTGNKALLATHGAEIFEAADQVGASVSYEAAVAAAIPIIRPLRDSLAGDRIKRIFGIVNGSTNYILDSMDRQGLSAQEAQRIATELGYLEADPSLDLEGYDAAQKAAILASLAFHTQVSLDDVHRQGIESVTADMIADARRAGYVIKLLAVCERLNEDDGDAVSVRVYPALIDREHPMASVHGGNNAVFVEAEAAGPLMFYGAGAGGVQTASAVLGDVVSAARRHIAGGVGVGESARQSLPMAPFGHITTRYQITIEVADVTGVLATVAGILSDHGVSIATALQTIERGEQSSTARIVIGTHRATEQALSDTVARLADSDAVTRVLSVLRVEGE